MHAPIDLKPGLKSVTYVVLFVFAIALQGGCSESPEPAASAPEASVTKPAPNTAVAKALPGEDAPPRLPSAYYPEDDVPRGKPGPQSPQDSPAGQPLPADDRAESPAESSALSELDGTPSAEPDPATSLASENETLAPPATVFAAMKLLDLRKLPRMSEAEATVDTPTQVSLTVKASVSEAKRFYTDSLEKDGWKMVPPAVAMADSEDYGQLEFTKEGFHLGISLYRLPDSGLLSVGLNNYGNYDARKLPQPEGSEPLHMSFHIAMYVTSDKVPQVAEACAEQLQAAGWQGYIHPFTAYTEDTQQRSLTFKQNGLGLSAYIAVAPAQMNRTTVQYSMHMLGDELPIPADATKIEFLESPLQLTCEAKDEILPTLDFFRRELAARGWQEKGTGNQATSEAISVFQRSEGLPIVLKITRLGDDMPTSVSIAEFEMPREVPVETLTDAKKPAGELPAVDGVETDLPAGLAGLMTYEDWLKKNKYKPSLARLEQYAAEMEKAANSIGGEPAESEDADRGEQPESKPMKTAAAPGPSAKASGAAIAAIEKADGRVQTNDDEILTFVELTGKDFNDKQMKLLAGMSEMTYLNLSFTQVSDAGLAVVADMPKLEKLYLSGLKISDAGLKAVANMTELDLLVVSQTPITDAGLVHVKGLRNLERLSLFETKVTDKGMKTLLDLPKLKALDLSNTQITDAAIPQLVQLRNLEELNLAHTRLSPAGIKTLQAALPECEINE